MKRIEDSLKTSWTTLNTPTFEVQGSQKKKRKRKEEKIEMMQELFNKDLEELKNKHLEELKNKQTEMNNTIT